MEATATPPAGFELENGPSVKPPAGFELEHHDAAPTPPPGFQLEERPSLTAGSVTPESEARATAANQAIAKVRASGGGVIRPSLSPERAATVSRIAMGQPAVMNQPYQDVQRQQADAQSSLQNAVSAGGQMIARGGAATMADIPNMPREAVRQVAQAASDVPVREGPSATVGRIGTGLIEAAPTLMTGNVPAAMGVVGAMHGAGESQLQVDEARQQGRDIGAGRALAHTAVSTAVGGAAGYAGGKLMGETGRGSIAGDVIENLAGGMILGTGQQAAGNVSAKATGIDPNREISEDVARSGVENAAVQAGLPLAHEGLSRLTALPRRLPSVPAPIATDLQGMADRVAQQQPASEVHPEIQDWRAQQGYERAQQDYERARLEQKSRENFQDIKADVGYRRMMAVPKPPPGFELERPPTAEAPAQPAEPVRSSPEPTSSARPSATVESGAAEQTPVQPSLRTQGGNRQTSPQPTPPQEREQGEQPWQMTQGEWNSAWSDTEQNPSGTGGAAKYGMGRATTEKGFARILAARDAERNRLSDGIPPTAGTDPMGEPRTKWPTHRNVVEQALAAGKPVPPEVLADYPDLKPSLPPVETTGAPVDKQYVGHNDEKPYTIRDARYAKGRKIVEAPSDSDIKTRAARLAAQVGGKYVNRERGYNMSPAQAARFEKLYAANKDANTMTGEVFTPPSSESTAPLSEQMETGKGEQPFFHKAEANDVQITAGPHAGNAGKLVKQSAQGGARIEYTDDHGVTKTVIVPKGNWRRGMVALPDLEPAAQKIREQMQEASDATTSKVIPKLTRFGVQSEAVAAAKYRTRVGPMADDLIAKVMPDAYKDPKALNALGDVLNKDNVLGGYQAAVTAGDKEAAAAIAERHPIYQYRSDVRAAMSDPAMRQRIQRWKDVVNPVMDELFRKQKQIDPGTELPTRGAMTGARVNLVDVNHLPKWMEALKDHNAPAPESNPSSYRNPYTSKDKYDRAASFMGDYNTDIGQNLKVMLAHRLANTSKLDFYNALRRRGAIIQDKGGEIPDTIRGKPSAVLDIKMPQTDPQTGKTAIVMKDMVLPRELVAEARGVLGTDLPVRSWLFSAMAKPLNAVQMAGMVDGIVHTGNLLKVGGPMAGNPTIAEDIARRVPGLGMLGGIKDLARYGVEMMKDTPDIRAARARAAEQGVLRGYFPAGKLKPMHHVINFVDEAMRLAANDKFDMMTKRYGVADTPENRYQFVSQLGEYSRHLRGPVEQALRDLGVSPFIIAGRTMNAASRRLLFGSSGVGEGSAKGKLALRALGLSTVAGAVMLPAFANMGTTGTPFGRPGTPLGAIDLGTDDEKGSHNIFDVLQLAGIRRGARTLGLNALVNGVMQGKNAGQIIRDMGVEATQANLHPFVGPAPAFATKVITGKQPDIRGRMEAQRIPGGGPAQIAENTRAAMESQQPLLYAAAKPLLRKIGLDKTPDRGGGYFSDLLTKGVGKPSMSTVGVTTAQPGQDAAQDLASRLAREKYGDLGMTADEQQRLATAQPILVAMRKDPDSGKKMIEDALDARQLSEREAANIEKKAGMNPLQWNFRQLDAKDAANVWSQSTPDEKDQLREMMQGKIGRSVMSPGDQDQLYASTGVEKPADLDLRREASALRKKKNDAEEAGQRFVGKDALRLRQISSVQDSIGELNTLARKGRMSQAIADQRIKLLLSRAKPKQAA